MTSYAAYPLSPSPSSPDFAPRRQPPIETEPRRSKRDSTASVTRQREEAAERYPSPPPGTSARSNVRASGSGSRPQSIESSSLLIPPYNPSRRNQATPSSSTDSASPTPSDDRSLGADPSTRSGISNVDRFDQLSDLYSQPPSNGRNVGRPSSAAVTPVYASQIPTPVSSSTRSRQSVSVLPSAQNALLSSTGPYPTLYQPHPMPRQKIYFGPYVLLQTLGEGEFGKVKLGIHSERWGEEVAIKLIKRGNVDTAQRGEKVRREIEVLKAVRHPNIVRLYDVIETEKYIGIVLEYASGGELFDHILAHRYLKERDAARLFAQLISGVSYLHAKKVVHRDLKLENLLLDRNRNVIITDFGFANRFIDSADDLMATSCGSPCYAAPELVVQEGKYVGTAVDVWSCGVILYAMLAGYLPYDDDPANPEGDNINLLYKYIINTPLTFPEWISGEPRDLLLKMLVPDPRMRCTIEEVTAHSWLRKYAPTFSKSVEELETMAQDAEFTKRQMLEAQRQFLLQKHQAMSAVSTGGMTQAQAIAMARSQSSSGAATGVGSNNRHRSAMITPSVPFSPLTTSESSSSITTRSKSAAVAEDTSALPSIPPYQPPQSSTSSTSSQRNKRRSVQIQTAPVSPTIQSHLVTVDASPFSFVTRSPELPTSSPMSPSLSAPPNPPAVATDDMMVDSASSPIFPLLTPTEDEGRSRRSSARVASMSIPVFDSEGASVANEEELRRKRAANRSTVQVEYDGGAERKIREAAAMSTANTRMNAARQASVQSSEDTEMGSSEIGRDDDDTMKIDTRSLQSRTPTPMAISSPIPIDSPTMRSFADISLSPATATLLSSSSQSNMSIDAAASLRGVAPSLSRPTSPTSPISSSSSSRPRTGTASDRFSLRSLLGGTSMPAAETRDQTDDASNKRRSRRQKAMSLQPFSKGPSTAAARLVKANARAIDGTDRTDVQGRTRSSTLTPSPSLPSSMGPPAIPESASSRVIAARPVRASVRSPTATVSTLESASWTGSKSSATGPPPASKAKIVMDWFRRKSVRGTDAMGSSGSAPAPMTTDFDRYRPSTLSTVLEPLPSSASTATITARSPATRPSVIITEAPIPDSTNNSASTTTTRSSRPTTLEQRRLSKVQSPQSSPSSSTISVPLTNQVIAHETRLRVHQGALDRSAVTSKGPSLVMADIVNVLWSMGIETLREGDFKLKCVRGSRKKLLANAALSGGTTMPRSPSPLTSSRLSALDRRPTLPSSPSLISNLGNSPTISFRSFFNRKNSTSSAIITSPSSPILSSPSVTTPLSPDSDLLASPMSVSQARFGNSPQPLPVYGDAGTTDTGDEVRFQIEITQVKNLAGLYYVDIKRMRGGPWCFKFLYDRILQEVDLGVWLAS